MYLLSLYLFDYCHLVILLYFLFCDLVSLYITHWAFLIVCASLFCFILYTMLGSLDYFLNKFLWKVTSFIQTKSFVYFNRFNFILFSLVFKSEYGVVIFGNVTKWQINSGLIWNKKRCIIGIKYHSIHNLRWKQLFYFNFL